MKFKINRLNLKAFCFFYCLIYGLFLLTLYLTGNLVYFTHGFSSNEATYLKSLNQTIPALYESNGTAGTKTFLQHIYKQKKIAVFLVLPNTHIISYLPPTQAVKNIAQTGITPSYFTTAYKQEGLFVFIIKNKNTMPYRMVLDLSKQTIDLTTSYLSLPLPMRTSFAIFFAGMIFYMASSILYAPLKKIMEAIKQISQGKLETRLGPIFKNRHDELAALGKNFDVMASNLESLHQSKEEMFEHITHELRSPIARIQIALALLKTNANNPDHQVIHHELAQLNTLIDNILSLAKLRQVNKLQHKELFELNDVLKDVATKANYEQNTSAVSVQQHKPIFLTADKRLIHCAIENIVRNAVLHSGNQSKVTITVTSNSQDVFITVSDNGPGIPEHKLNNIFEPFIQAPNSLNTQKSYGLGLAITKKIIQIHQGTITARNTSPQGLQVTVQLPLN